jgi:hypothetical protein
VAITSLLAHQEVAAAETRRLRDGLRQQGTGINFVDTLLKAMGESTQTAA